MKLRYYFFMAVLPFLTCAMEQEETLVTQKFEIATKQPKSMQQIKEEATELSERFHRIFQLIYSLDIDNPDPNASDEFLSFVDDFPQLSKKAETLMEDIDEILKQPISDSDKKIFNSLMFTLQTIFPLLRQVYYQFTSTKSHIEREEEQGKDIETIMKEYQ